MTLCAETVTPEAYAELYSQGAKLLPDQDLASAGRKSATRAPPVIVMNAQCFTSIKQLPAQMTLWSETLPADVYTERFNEGAERLAEGEACRRGDIAMAFESYHDLGVRTVPGFESTV